jgi:hypothetical protein
MQIYIVATAEKSEDGGMTIAYKKSLFLVKSSAFEEVMKLGESACAMEFVFHNSWNLDEIKKFNENK